jgi:ribosome-binding ATPase YchF (GTP1/OBG family)
MISHLEEGKLALDLYLEKEEEDLLKEFHLLTRKPMLYVLNTDEEVQPDNSKFKAQLHMAMSIKMELELVDMPEEEQIAFLKSLGFDSSGLDRLINECYKLLKLLTYFTTGEKETRAWTVPEGTFAPKAAGVIHTDFEAGFIRAEVIHFKDFISCNGELGAKDDGKMQIEGKDYIIKDGDVCHFRFSN